MGDAKTKKAVEPSARTIYPWVLYFEPSETDEELTRLCITHQESDRFKILETYHPDEIESALASAISAVHMRKHMLTMHMLHIQTVSSDCELFAILYPMIPTSRSTEALMRSTTGSIVSVLGGIREF